MTVTSSHREILRSSSIIGLASAANVALGVVRMKFVAVVLGPAGIGLIGMLNSLLSTASQVSAAGVGLAGTRQIAIERESESAAHRRLVRTALRCVVMGLGALGGGLVWFNREWVAFQLFADSKHALAVGWLGIGIFLNVAAVSQQAVLGGLRRISDQAWLSVTSAVLTTVIGIAIIVSWGTQGIVPYVLLTPIIAYLLGWYFVSRKAVRDAFANEITESSKVRHNLRVRVTSTDLGIEIRELLRMGMPLMFGGFVATFSALLVRAFVARESGTIGLGVFHAAWTLSMTYLVFVLSAMSRDYFPRLTAAIGDREASNRLVNEQTEVALLLAGPLLIGMIGLAPWIIQFLYSKEFVEAAGILRWQLVGDVLKVASWPMGFLILAMGKSSFFMLKETAVWGGFVTISWILLERIGLLATGVAYLGMYAINLPFLILMCRRLSGFHWTKGNLRSISSLVFLSSTISILGAFHERYAAITGTVLALALIVHSWRKLTRLLRQNNEAI